MSEPQINLLNLFLAKNAGQQQLLRQQQAQSSAKPTANEPRASWNAQNNYVSVSNKPDADDDSEPEDQEDEEVKALSSGEIAFNAASSGGTDDSNQSHLNTFACIESLCQRTVAKILVNLNNNEALEAEEALWRQISKVYRHNLTVEIAHYLLGFYGTMCEILFLASHPEDPFLRMNRVSFNLARSNRALLYVLHIHMGDLYRYIDSKQSARHYYQQAVHIDPSKGMAYNQLAFCTPLSKAYKCLYFSIFAANSVQASLPTATSNIASVLSRMDTPFFERFRDRLALKLDKSKTFKVEPPADGADWFYLVVISIHFNDFNVSLLALLDYLISIVGDEDKKANGDLDFVLMALEVSLDWITINRDSANDVVKSALSNMGMQMKDAEGCRSKLLDQSGMDVALKHNYLLRNFKPLSELYGKLVYDEAHKVYLAKRDRSFLKSRLALKLQNF